MQRLSDHCNALFSAIRTPCCPIALMELKPALEKLLLVGDFRYTCLRDLEWRFGGSKTIGPEL
jgi:hypothetical protein